MPNFLRLCLMTALVLCGLVPPAVAQGQFSPAIKVNEEVITRYELDQRARMLRLFRAPGDPREEAETQLVEEFCSAYCTKRCFLDLSCCPSR